MTVPIPLPIRSSAEVVERLVAAIAGEPRCRLALLDHVTSPTALVLDIATIAARLATEAPHVRLRDELRPVITSHGEPPGAGPANRFHARFDWSGTHDPTAYLATPAAIDDLAARGGGWPAIRARNHALLLAARDLLIGRLGNGATPIAPDDSPTPCSLAISEAARWLFRRERFQVFTLQ